MKTQLRLDLAKQSVMHLEQELETLRSFAPHIHGPQLGILKRMINRTNGLLNAALVELDEVRKVNLAEYHQMHSEFLAQLSERMAQEAKPKFEVIFIDYPACERRSGLSEGMIKDISDAITSLREEYGVKVNCGSDQDVDKKVDTTLKPQFTPNMYQAGINQELQTVHNYSLIESLNMISSSEDDVAKWSREGRSTHWCAVQLHIQYNTK